MADITLTITNAGRAALVAAGTNGTLPVHVVSCGLSGAAVVPNVAATYLPGEFGRIGTVAGNAVSADTIHIVVEDTSPGVYELRSFALYLADGTLFAIYGQATPILSKSAAAILLLVADIRFADINAANIAFGNTNFLNPPATENVQGVVEIATQAEADAGESDVLAVTPKKAKAAVLAWLGYAPVNRAGDYMTGDLTLVHPGQVALELNSSGNAIARLCVQADGNVVLYRNGGAGYRPVWSVIGQEGPFVLSMPMTRQGNTVWDAGNDGSGSGLDADLLDGQDGSYYSNVVARLGYAPVNRAGDYMTGDLSLVHPGQVAFELNSSGNAIARLCVQADGNVVLYRNGGTGYRPVWSVIGQDGPFVLSMPMTRQGNTVWDAGNDGAGSGLDADLLRGQHWSSGQDVTFGTANLYRMRAGANGDGKAVAIGDDVWLGDINALHTFSVRGQQDERQGWVRFGNSAHSLGCSPDDGTLRYQGGNTVWHAGIDGSGSGLDADLLDGRHASDFALNADFGNRNLAANGYQVLPGGLIMQWGMSDQVYAEGPSAVNFPIPFPNACFSVTATLIQSGGGGNNVDQHAQVVNTGLEECTLYFQRANGGNFTWPVAAYWMAFGR